MSAGNYAVVCLKVMKNCREPYLVVSETAYWKEWTWTDQREYDTPVFCYPTREEASNVCRAANKAYAEDCQVDEH